MLIIVRRAPIETSGRVVAWVATVVGDRRPDARQAGVGGLADRDVPPARRCGLRALQPVHDRALVRSRRSESRDRHRLGRTGSCATRSISRTSWRTSAISPRTHRLRERRDPQGSRQLAQLVRISCEEEVLVARSGVRGIPAARSLPTHPVRVLKRGQHRACDHQTTRSFRARALPFLLVVPLVGGARRSRTSPCPRAVREAGCRWPPALPAASLHPLAETSRPDETTLDGCDARSRRASSKRSATSRSETARRRRSPCSKREWRPIPRSRRTATGSRTRSARPALARFDGDVARTFSLGSPTCVSGYYHGILERAFLGVSSKLRSFAAVARRSVSEAGCDAVASSTTVPARARARVDDPDGLRPSARAVRLREPRHGLGRKACAGGAFMENLDTRFGFRSAWLDDDDPLYPCKTVSPVDRRSCYLRASWRIHTLDGGDYESDGRDVRALGAWTAHVLQRLRTRRRRGRPLRRGRDSPSLPKGRTGESDCFVGAARTIANASGVRGIAPAAALCRRAPEYTRAACFAGVGLVLGMLRPTDATRRGACASLTARYVDACARAASAEVDPSGRQSWG